MNTYLLFASERHEARGGINDCIGSFACADDDAARPLADAVINEQRCPIDYFFDLVCVAEGTWRIVEYRPVFKPLPQSPELCIMLGDLA